MFKCAKSFRKCYVYMIETRKLSTSKLRTNKQNYYDILKLQPNCTAKDIRNSFLKLSKEFHPDKNHADPRNHVRFVQLNEAYSVLSRPQKRSEYDQRLVYCHRSNLAGQYSPDRRHYTYANEQFFWKTEYTSTRKDLKGSKKLSKSWIVFLCIVFTAAGVGLQVLAVRRSLTFSRDKLDQLSEANGRVLADVRKRASENGNETQLEVIRQRIEESVYQHNLCRKKDN